MTRVPQSRWGLRARVAAAMSFAAVLALAVPGAIGLAAPNRSTQAPENTQLPTISGIAGVGRTLGATRGEWSENPILFEYQWQRCVAGGTRCADIQGAKQRTYTATAADRGLTLLVVVTASNRVGSSTATSARSLVVVAAGCPGAGTGSAPISELSLPAHLQISGWNVIGRINRQTRRFSLQVRVGSTCRRLIQGASVFVTAVPFNQFSVPAEPLTGSRGVATLTFTRRAGFPASNRQQRLTFFIRARNPAERVLRGVTARRLVAVPFR